MAFRSNLRPSEVSVMVRISAVVVSVSLSALIAAFRTFDIAFLRLFWRSGAGKAKSSERKLSVEIHFVEFSFTSC
jgi:hypothetical protein